MFLLFMVVLLLSLVVVLLLALVLLLVLLFLLLVVVLLLFMVVLLFVGGGEGGGVVVVVDIVGFCGTAAAVFHLHLLCLTNSRSSLHHYDNPQEQEMIFVGRHPDDHYSSMPGTPDTTAKPNRPGSAESSNSVGAWGDNSQTTTPIQKKKRIGSGKVSPALMPVHRTLSKQNSDSQLINGDTDSGSSTPEERQINTQQHKKTMMSFNVAKALMDHEEASSRRSAGLAYAKRQQLMANKEPLSRQSSDSRLLSNAEGHHGSPFTKPKLYKKMTWAGRTNSNPSKYH